MTTQTSFTNFFCESRKTAQLNNVPTPPRIELQPSPYEAGFSQEQLNMRRKYEILQYNPTTQSTQTNTLTKKQQYSLIMRGYGPQSRRSTATLEQNTNCQEPPTVSTASNIPGPPIYLYKDPNVPLYNYIPPPNDPSITNLPNVL
jgi:hypothetical protein